MKNLRSINSIIKRWHGKIKYEVEMKNVRESTGRFTRILPEPPAKAKDDGDIAEEDNEDRLVTWKKTWTERDDKKLKLLVIESGIMDWKLLSEALEVDAD